MAIYKHKMVGGLYRVVGVSFDVARQEPHWVYVSLKTGQVFNRSQADFAEKFKLVDAHPQSRIEPQEARV